MPFTIQDMIKSVARELRLRESVYPAAIARGKMTPEYAEREIGCMKAVLENLKTQAPPEPEQGRLFGGENHGRK